MLFLFLATLFYFLPSIIARNKVDFTAILLFNFFLGWTGIGWLAAMVWAIVASDGVPLRYVPVSPVGYAPVSSGRFCSQCGVLGPVNARYCAACGRAV